MATLWEADFLQTPAAAKAWFDDMMACAQEIGGDSQQRKQDFYQHNDEAEIQQYFEIVQNACQFWNLGSSIDDVLNGDNCAPPSFYLWLAFGYGVKLGMLDRRQYELAKDHVFKEVSAKFTNKKNAGEPRTNMAAAMTRMHTLVVEKKVAITTAAHLVERQLEEEKVPGRPKWGAIYNAWRKQSQEIIQ